MVNDFLKVKQTKEGRTPLALPEGFFLNKPLIILQIIRTSTLTKSMFILTISIFIFPFT